MKLRSKALKALQYTRYNLTDSPAICLLMDFAAQAPGLEYGNYASSASDLNGRRAYFQESRSITKQWRALCEAILEANSVGVVDQDVIDASKSAYSGRLRWGKDSVGVFSNSPHLHYWHYCTGQYFPTEYRQAAYAVLSEAIHNRRRASFQPLPDRSYTLNEMREIARTSGSHFFTNGRPGERYKLLATNTVLASLVDHHAVYQFSPKTGSFDYISSLVEFKEKAA